MAQHAGQRVDQPGIPGIAAANRPCWPTGKGAGKGAGIPARISLSLSEPGDRDRLRRPGTLAVVGGLVLLAVLGALTSISA